MVGPGYRKVKKFDGIAISTQYKNVTSIRTTERDDRHYAIT